MYLEHRICYLYVNEYHDLSNKSIFAHDIIE